MLGQSMLVARLAQIKPAEELGAEWRVASKVWHTVTSEDTTE